MEKKYKVVGHCGYTDEDLDQEEIRIGTILSHSDIATGTPKGDICPMSDIYPLADRLCDMLNCTECLPLFECIEEVK